MDNGPCEKCDRQKEEKHPSWSKWTRVNMMEGEDRIRERKSVDDFIDNFIRQFRNPSSRLSKKIERNMTTTKSYFFFSKPSSLSLLLDDKEYHVWKRMSNLSPEYRHRCRDVIQEAMDTATQGTPIMAIYSHIDNTIAIQWTSNRPTLVSI